VTCEVHTRTHELAIHAHDLTERFLAPGELAELPPRIRHEFRDLLPAVERTPAGLRIERRIDEITVIDQTEGVLATSFGSEVALGEHSGHVRRCGSAPTVDAIDAVRVDLGRHSDSANLDLDLRYGLLAPGATDEGDGNSEIELAAHLGTGYANVTLTRGPDTVFLARPTGGGTAPTAVNLNQLEPAPDADLTIGHRSAVLIYGGGGDDSLASSGGRPVPDEESPAILAGGQGDDELVGGTGYDELFDGPGRDRLSAGPGVDAILALGHAPDRIDCGPGFDLALVRGSRSSVRNCERVLTGADLGFGGVDSDDIGFGKKLRAARVQAALSRLARSR
jgi:Ca2+-binding RTX toxin-like protein